MLVLRPDRRTNYVSFNPSYWNQSKTDGQTTFDFIPHIGIYKQKDRQTTFHFTPHIEITRQTDGQTTFYSTPHSSIGIQVRQTDKLRFISFLILESTTNRKTNYVLFHPTNWNLRKTGRRTNFVSFHTSYWIPVTIRTNYNSFHPSHWNPS